jgi:hypothetical protein
MAPRMKPQDDRFDAESFDWSGLAPAKKSIQPTQVNAWEDIRTLSTAQKANLVISDFTSAGALPPKAADQFIIGAVLQSELLSMVSSDTYDVPTFNVPWSQFSGQILYAGTQGQAVPAAQRSKPGFGQSPLNFTEFRGQVRIDDGVFENQIERSGLLNTIMGQINIGVGANIEDAAINSNTGGTYVPGNNLYTTLPLGGWLQKQTSYVVTGSNVTLDKTALKRLWKTLPRQYRRDKRKMRFMTATDAEVDYVDTLSNRIGEKADVALREGENGKWNGIEIVPVPLFPTTVGVGATNTTVLLADPKNLWIGFQRIVKLEQWRDPDAMQTVFSISVKFDVAIGFEPATATFNNVLLTTGS